MELVWIPRARRARQEAIEYIAQDNLGAALGQLDEIERQTDMLIQHPEMGRPGRRDGTRELVISRTPFIVVYRLKPRAGRIELIRFLHGKQQWPTK
ncbi:type II toxin-antitoxin system RelE/ParE family toxin [Xanthomonas euvesicatoria pv. euvesicatoria]|uniref:type II toxin-antitoxin system RelE/ParE family toxin n=1 Tax=Xanthomonas TaxID=338 RepID=UPI00052E2915|nr:type II toxin-antitoxin system RelE/ParE family toxin [Xanthomonas euvesicatoria]RBB62287.1 type II toxin-antitoxin system RelE/ParE family toxin [Xanthomonas oryzae pv. oryzae]WDN17684.1 type II toxin-antitoxin system RelE/ParE family toxin [Xanthomonas oryzae]CEH37985.1 Addiction module antitoxin [Xanthomonas citri pv. citri]MDW7700166.1 type II toxin-antitoxin system RelE/ParE family toxin [Xanthomonas euvesicatoria]MDW7704323.1 type II toxin-antitoxin system RelE/ParE family toxin [Xant